MEETDLNLDTIEKEITNKNAVEDRMRNLKQREVDALRKVEEESKAKQEALDKLATLEKDTSFLNTFTDITAKFPTASEFKDKIKEKVNAGYSVDDATVAVLVAEGKYTPPVARAENVSGGSAPNQITNQSTKTVTDMSGSERWDALREAEKRGDIGLS